MIASRSNEVPKSNVPPTGERAGAQPKNTPPTRNDQAGRSRLAAKLKTSATISFCRSNRDRRTGIASR